MSLTVRDIIVASCFRKGWDVRSVDCAVLSFVVYGSLLCVEVKMCHLTDKYEYQTQAKTKNPE